MEARRALNKRIKVWCWWTGILFLCVWFLLLIGCKKAPSLKKSEKDVYGKEDLTTLFAGDPESLAEFQRTQKEMMAQNYPAAVQGLEKMALRSSNAPWMETVKFNLAQTYMMMSDYRKALDLFDQFLKQYPSSKVASKALLYTGEIYLSLGTDGSSNGVEGSLGRYYLQKSVEIFEQVIKGYSSDRESIVQAQYLIGSAYASLGDPDRAISSFEKVVNDNKDSNYAPKAMYRIAGVQLSKGDVDEAEKSFGRLTAQYPNSLEAQKARKKLEGLGLIATRALPLAVKEWIGTPPPEVTTLQGKVMLLSFWAIWCPHCRRNIPKMDNLVERYVDKGLLVVGITREKAGYETEKIREFIKTHPMRFPTGIDNQGKTSEEFAVSDVPCIVLIDKKGRIRWHGHPEYIQDHFIETLLAEAG